MAEEEFAAVDGYVEIPDRPGLGITVNETVADRYRKDWR